MASFRYVFVALPVVVAASAANAGAGIPQMDATWFPNQLLWLAVSFGLLYVAVAKFIAPRIESVLHTRQEAIAAAIAEAEKAKREAEVTRGDFESSGKAARAKAAELVATAQAQSSRDVADALTKMDRELARKLEHAEAVVQDALAKAQAGMQAATADLTAAMSSKLLGSAVDAGAVARAVETVKKAG